MKLKYEIITAPAYLSDMMLFTVLYGWLKPFPSLGISFHGFIFLPFASIISTSWFPCSKRIVLSVCLFAIFQIIFSNNCAVTYMRILILPIVTVISTWQAWLALSFLGHVLVASNLSTPNFGMVSFAATPSTWVDQSPCCSYIATCASTS